MNIIFKIYLTIIALLPAVMVFLVKESINIFPVALDPICIYILYFILLLFLNYLSIFLSQKLGTANIPKNSITSIEQANDSFLPSYLGYFFVSLSIPSMDIFIIIFLLIGVLVFFSRSAYFNPIFLLFGFSFYYCITKEGAKILIITKKDLKLPSNVFFQDIKRINNFTFIETRSVKNG